MLLKNLIINTLYFLLLILCMCFSLCLKDEKVIPALIFFLINKVNKDIYFSALYLHFIIISAFSALI